MPSGRIDNISYLVKPSEQEKMRLNIDSPYAYVLELANTLVEPETIIEVYEEYKTQYDLSEKLFPWSQRRLEYI